MLSSHWCDFDGLSALFGVSTEQLTAMHEAAGMTCCDANKKDNASSFLVKNFIKCLSLHVDATVEVS